jgi:hypothetical protein
MEIEATLSDEREVVVKGTICGPEPDVGLGWNVDDFVVTDVDGNEITDLSDSEKQVLVDQLLERFHEQYRR